MNRFNIKHLQTGLTERVLSGSIWVLCGTFAAKALAFITTIIVARILSKDVYGQLSIIRSTIIFFAGISGCGIGATATRYIAKYKQCDSLQTLKTYLVANIFVWTMATFICILLIIFSDTLAVNRLNDPTLAPCIKISAVILFFTLINGAQTGTLSGFEDFKNIAKVNLVMGVTEIALLPLGAIFFGLTGAVLGFGLVYAVAFVVNGFYIRTHINSLGLKPSYVLHNKLQPSDFKILLSFSLPLAATSWISMTVYWWLKTAIVHDSGFSNMANYDVGDQWKTIMLILPGIVANVVLPILSSVLNDAEKEQKVMMLNLWINLAITVILSIIVFIASPYILSFYGPEYTNNIPLFILCFSAILDSVSNWCGTIFMAKEKVKYGLVTNIIWATSIVCFYILLVRKNEGGLHLDNYLAEAYFLASAVQVIACLTVAKIKKLI